MTRKIEKSETRKLMEQLHAKTGEALITINCRAYQLIEVGLCRDVTEALTYLLEIVNEGRYQTYERQS